MESINTLTLEKLQAELESLEAKADRLEVSRKDQLSIAIVSGDMDKILAAMIISLAAAAMDTQVKLFFSFWALSALRDPRKKVRGKDFISKMSIAAKEARETRYWLRLLKQSKLVELQYDFYLTDIESIINILTKIVKTSTATVSRC